MTEGIYGLKTGDLLVEDEVSEKKVREYEEKERSYALVVSKNEYSPSKESQKILMPSSLIILCQYDFNCNSFVDATERNGTIRK